MPKTSWEGEMHGSGINPRGGLCQRLEAESKTLSKIETTWTDVLCLIKLAPFHFEHGSITAYPRCHYLRTYPSAFQKHEVWQFRFTSSFVSHFQVTTTSADVALLLIQVQTSIDVDTKQNPITSCWWMAGAAEASCALEG